MDALLDHTLSGETSDASAARRVSVVRRLMKDDAAPAGDELAGLIRKVASDGDRQAYARLYSYFAPRVNAFLRKSGLPANTAEEIAQEVMLNVWRKASYFDPARAAASTWIFTIARNQRIDYLRRAKVTPGAESWMAEESEAAPSSETLLLTAEREACVRAALKSLSTEQATVLTLSFFSDKAHAEIAHELGLPLGTVKSRVRLALGRLRALLDAEL